MLPDMTEDVPRLVVTAHPNHELAIFGFVLRMRPRMLFLTDGGGPQRVNESRQALASIGMLDRATFLDRTETELYDALLELDGDVFGRMVDDVRRELLAVKPRQVICESIELYNPLHDITLPIVRAAAGGIEGVEIIEFPLIAQEPAAEERYRLQRFPPGRDGVATLVLDESELDRKLHVRDHQYDSLRRSTQAVSTVSREVAGTEVFARAAAAHPKPGRDCVLRYEARGHLLHARGEVQRVITYADHFLPAVTMLDALGAAG